MAELPLDGFAAAATPCFRGGLSVQFRLHQCQSAVMVFVMTNPDLGPAFDGRQFPQGPAQRQVATLAIDTRLFQQ